jgi:hypothetical protein
MSTMSRLEDFRARHAVEIKELYERSAARWKIPETQWAGAIYRAAIPSGSVASRSSFASEVSRTLVHPDDFAFAVAFRLGCSEAVNNFEAKYKVLLHDLALDITHDERRATNLAEVVFQEIYGELEEDGRRSSPLQDFDGRVSLLDWLRALLKQRDAGELNARVPKFYAPTTRSAPADTSCPPHEALAAYRDLVELGGVPHRGRRLPAKERARIRHHLRVCLSCQTQLVAGRANDLDSGELQAAASEQANRSTVLPLHVMGIAGIVGILVWTAWLAGQPQRFVGRARTILQAAAGQARDVAETRRETPSDGIPSGVGTASRASEARERPLTAGLSTAESSRSTSGDKSHATLPPSVAPHSQLPDSGLDTKVVADFSKNQDFALGKGSAVTAANHQGVRNTPVPSIQGANLQKRTPYHIESDRLYTMEQAKSLIQRFRTLGYTADATPVESGDETMYQIEVGTYKTADEADDAADDLESRYNAIFTSPPR